MAQVTRAKLLLAGLRAKSVVAAVEVISPAALRADIAGRLRRALVAYDDASTSGSNELDRFGQG